MSKRTLSVAVNKSIWLSLAMILAGSAMISVLNVKRAYTESLFSSSHSAATETRTPYLALINPPTGSSQSLPPETLQDWIRTHGALPLTRYDFDDHVVIYVDGDVNRNDIGWVLPFASQAFQYMKTTYSHFGPDRLYVFLHQGRFGGGTISSYFDAFSGFRNATDTGSNSWVRSINNINIDLISHEMCHIVEGSNNGIHESPAFTVWGDSKWAEFFQYDLYVALGMPGDADRVFNRFMNTSDNFPRPDTRWFRDWFYPLWLDFGGAQVMARFFRLLAEHFPKRPENDGHNLIYTRRMSMGEFIHFMSGAAGTNLTAMATNAFGWTDELQIQYELAIENFPTITYQNFPRLVNQRHVNLALNKPATSSTPCNPNEGPEKAFNGSISGGNSDKWCSLAATKFLQVDLGAPSTLSTVVVKHAGAGGESTAFNTRDFNIQVSADGTNFTTVEEVRGNTLSRTIHAIFAENVRFVRLNVITATQTDGPAARIYELEVRGRQERKNSPRI